MFKKILLALLCLGSLTQASTYDVYGRDMAFSENNWRSYMNSIGHLGIEYQNKILNMYSPASKKRTTNGQKNFLHVESINKFKSAVSKEKNWGKVSPKVKNKHMANIVLERTKLIGATYTYTSGYRTPKLVYNPRTREIKGLRGKYRCDTFVYDVLVKGGRSKRYTILPKLLYNDIKKNH